MNRERYVKYLFILPCLGYILVFSIFPLAYTIVLSFMNWRLGASPSFAGVQNFIDLMRDERFLNDLVFTSKFVAVSVTLEFLIGFVAALLLNKEGVKGKSIIRTILLLPLFACPVVVGYMFVNIFYEEAGPFNLLLTSINPAWKVPWRSDPFWAFVSVAYCDVWMWTPFLFIVLYAGLQSLPRDPTEAALVDGASRLQILRHITLPMMRPVILTVLLLKLVESIKIFDVIFTLTEGGPGISTESISLYIYKVALRFFNLGYSSALGIFYLIILLPLISVILYLFRGIYEV